MRRLDLKLLQKQVAEQIGVEVDTVSNWERNASLPIARYIPGIIRFLGYDPSPPATSLARRLISGRRALGLSQRMMAARLGVDPSAVRDWEAGSHQPTAKSRRLIDEGLKFNTARSSLVVESH